MASDNFNRADEDPIAGNWTIVEGNVRLVSNTMAGPSAPADSLAYYNADTPQNDQFSEIVAATPSNNDWGVACRISAGANGYVFEVFDATPQFAKIVSGTFTQLNTLSPWTNVAAADVVRIEAAGTTLRAKVNGVEVGGSPLTDSSIASGGAGAFFFDNNVRLDNWQGGSLAATPVGFYGTRRPAGIKSGPRDRLGFLLQRVWDYTIAVVSNVLVTADVGSLLLSGFAPVLATSIATNVGALTLTGQAPSVVVGTVLTPAVGSLTITGLAPSVVIGTVVTPGVGALTLTGVAPSLGSGIAAGVGSLTLSGFAPVLNTSIAAGVGALTLSGLAPAANIGVNIQTGVGACTLSGFAPTIAVSDNKTAASGLGALTLNGLPPTVTASDNKSAAPGVGALQLAGFAPAPSINVRAFPGLGALALTGFAPTISIVSGSFVFRVGDTWLTSNERTALLTGNERTALLTAAERTALLTPNERTAVLTPAERTSILTPGT